MQDDCATFCIFKKGLLSYLYKLTSYTAKSCFLWDLSFDNCSPFIWETSLCSSVNIHSLISYTQMTYFLLWCIEVTVINRWRTLFCSCTAWGADNDVDKSLWFVPATDLLIAPDTYSPCWFFEAFARISASTISHACIMSWNASSYLAL